MHRVKGLSALPQRPAHPRAEGPMPSARRIRRTAGPADAAAASAIPWDEAVSVTGRYYFRNDKTGRRLILKQTAPHEAYP